MIKKILVSICLLLSLVLSAQQGTSSPYSFYGIGDVRFRGTIENRSMAGMAVVPDSIHLNIQNPAMYSNLKLTNFSIGGTFASTKLITNEQNEKAQRTTLDYLAVGLPLKKIGIGFGLIPYSSVGYNIQSSITDNTIKTTNFYKGNGSLNKVFIGFGFQISKKLSFGADAQYNFGKITTSNIALRYVQVSVATDGTPIYEQVQYGSIEANTSSASGINFNTGLSFKSKLQKDISIFSSVTYSPEATLKYNNTREVGLVQGANGVNIVGVGEPTVIDVPNTKIKLPSKFTFGLGIGDEKKWIIGSEVTFQNNSNFGNRFNDITNVSYENATRYTLGGYYIPNYKSFSSYFKRVVYRGGFRYENTGLVIDNKSIQDAALTLGMGMPLRGTFSNLNIGFELGNRGTKASGLVREHYMNFSIGLSLNDKWFQKRKFN
jgi:long-subunit fatty acid transport protein